MDIVRKVTFSDGSVIRSYGHGHWIPIPDVCVPTWVLNLLNQPTDDEMMPYVRQDVIGQGVFEYFKVPKISFPEANSVVLGADKEA